VRGLCAGNPHGRHGLWFVEVGLWHHESRHGSTPLFLPAVDSLTSMPRSDAFYSCVDERVVRGQVSAGRSATASNRRWPSAPCASARA
jgi:hypothetical protein